MRQDAHAAQILEGDIRLAGQRVRIWDGDIQLLMQERLGEEISGISSQPRYFADLQRTLCHQSHFAAERGHSDHPHALRLHPDTDLHLAAPL